MTTTTLPLADSAVDDPLNRTPRRPSRPQIDTGLAIQTASIAEDEPDILFHNYLRAFYDFDPHASLPADEEALQMTASIRAGDLILVHTIHANGWADGTVLTTGIRGWLPTNYCEPYDHSYLRNLLNALCQFWDLLGGSEEANLSTFVRQDYIRGLIAGVRYLLEHADCLHRDSPLVQKRTGIRRMRKGLLADLSSLVQLAKRLQETISEPFTEEVVHGLLDDLMTRAFKVVIRAVGFVDIWTQESGQVQPAPQEDDAQSTATPVDSAVDLEVKTTFSSTPKASIDHTRRQSQSEASSSSEVSPATTDPRRLSAKPPRPLSRSVRTRPGSVAHRVSVIGSSSSPASYSERPSTLASQQLAEAHDLCISHIGAFIGHHLHSQPSSDLANTTDNLVIACQKLLGIMNEVCSHDPKGFVSIQPVRDAFESKIAEAEKSTRDVFRFFDSEDEGAVMLPNTSNHLVTVGTDLIRISAECVGKIRSMIEQIGDFDLSHPLSPMPNRDQMASLATNQSIDSTTTPEKQREKRMSSKALPPPPPIHTRVSSTIVAHDFGAPFPSAVSEIVSPMTPVSAVTSPLPSSSASIVKRHSTIRASQTSNQGSDIAKSPQTGVIGSGRKGSIGCCSTIEASSARDSAVTTSSGPSTRATTPDHAKDQSPIAALNGFASVSSLLSHSGNEAEPEVDESQLLQRTYANELMLNKGGQVSGGSLAALIEQLTTHDSAPDATFVSAFYITFRQFATPREFAHALTERFDYIGDNKAAGGPVRLRIFNVFKNWLETYWSFDADKEALGDIRYFAMHKLKPLLPSAGDRLVELTKKISDSYASNAHCSLSSAISKSSAASKLEPLNAPEPMISRSQMNALRTALSTGSMSGCSITDFEPMELARQVTLMASKIYCDIHPEELVGLEWTKRESDKGKNVRNLCGLNTDLANVVGDSILAPETAKHRALVIKQWAKVAKCCLDLNNYETVMSITCQLNSSVVQRLKRTWQLVSKKTLARLEELNAIVDVSGNYRSLRKRLENPPVPCVPFLGVSLTDLTFNDAGNPKMREIPGGATATGAPITVINFDKHMRTARIINHVQRFQIPYKLQPVPEMQAWIEMHMERMRACHDQNVTNFHRRSLVIEPKLEDPPSRLQARKDSVPSIASGKQGSIASDQDRPKTPAPPSAHPESAAVREKFGTFFKGNAFAFITTSSASTHSTLPSPVCEEIVLAK